MGSYMSIYTLRPYQQRALNEIRKAIVEGHKSILLQAPTAAGKSVMFAEIIRSAYEKGKTVFFGVHRQEILYQVIRYMEKLNIPHGVIKSGYKHEDWHPVQLASLQTAYRRLSGPYVTEADIVIQDECHRSTAKTYLEVLQKHQKNILIGFSATPTRKSGKGLGTLFTKLINGKDYGASIIELTNQGYLAPLRYIAPIIPKLDGIPTVGGDYSLSGLETVMLQGKLIDDIVGNWFKYGEYRQTIVFATGVKHSIAIRDLFIKAGVASAHVDGTTIDDERSAILDAFKAGDIQVLCNCEIYTEGVDLPNASCMIMARPTKSLTLWMQACGRIMRISPGKVDAIVIDHAGCCYEHGFVHEITKWELDSHTRTSNSNNDARKSRNSQPISCPACNNLYTGQLRCPMCGNIPVKAQFGQDKDIYIDGILGEVVLSTGKAKVRLPTLAEKKDWFQQIKNYQFAHGKNDHWTERFYFEKFSEWPKGMKNLPIKETSPEVASWIKSRQIRYAKGKGKAKAKGATP
jgi:superfamily II DNA or RNA helicase